MSIYNPRISPSMKRSEIGLFGRVMNNNELCSDWLFTVPLISKKETQGGKYIFKYFLSQLFRRLIILYIKCGHQGAVIITRGIEIVFERSVDRVIVSLSRDAMHKLCLYYGATVLTTHFTISGGRYGGREVQNNITKCETLLRSSRQIYILEKKFAYHKTQLHGKNTFTKDETNLHFRKQINKTQNTFTSPETNLQ